MVIQDVCNMTKLYHYLVWWRTVVIQSVQCCQSIAENLGLVCLQQLASLCITSEPNLTNLQENKPHSFLCTDRMPGCQWTVCRQLLPRARMREAGLSNRFCPSVVCLSSVCPVKKIEISRFTGLNDSPVEVFHGG